MTKTASLVSLWRKGVGARNKKDWKREKKIGRSEESKRRKEESEEHLSTPVCSDDDTMTLTFGPSENAATYCPPASLSSQL